MNKEAIVMLNTIPRVKQFALVTNEFDCDIEVIAGKWTVDGKSIMGLFSLNLLEPLLVKIDSDNKKEIESFNIVMEEFKYEGNS